MDTNNDSIDDVIAFQPKLEANQKKQYVLAVSNNSKIILNDSLVAYSRIARERIDDYTWENDKVAFRVYGPEAQRLIESGDTEGINSRGIDCWLKRVDYPIINKWYKKYSDGVGTYHEDTGEGYDPYHVGNSLGCGGLCVYDTASHELTYSKNYYKWQTITSGTLLTQFNLYYPPFTVDNKTIAENRRVTLSKGSNLSKHEVYFEGADTINTITIGLTLHKNSGETYVNIEKGIFSYWESIDDSFVGTAIVVNPKYIISYSKLATEDKDKSHLFIQLAPANNKLVYYSGFGWVKSNQFKNNKEWINYLNEYSITIQSPLKLTYIK